MTFCQFRKECFFVFTLTLFSLPNLASADTADTIDFGTPTSYAIGGSPKSITSADFDKDGNTDVAVANSADNTVSVLLGKSDDTFQTQVTYPSGTTPYSIATGDFNGDGNPDLVVANFGNSTIDPSIVSILLGKGDGTFEDKVAYPVGPGISFSPYSVIVADFNGNGKAGQSPAFLSRTPILFQAEKGVEFGIQLFGAGVKNFEKLRAAFFFGNRSRFLQTLRQRRKGHRETKGLLLIDHFGDFKKLAFGGGGVAKHLVTNGTGPYLIGAEDILEVQHVACGLDLGGVEGLEFFDILQNRLQVFFKFLFLIRLQVKPCQLSDILDLKFHGIPPPSGCRL